MNSIRCHKRIVSKTRGRCFFLLFCRKLIWCCDLWTELTKKWKKTMVNYPKTTICSNNCRIQGKTNELTVPLSDLILNVFWVLGWVDHMILIIDNSPQDVVSLIISPPPPWEILNSFWHIWRVKSIKSCQLLA